ncbi:MAG: hypothetical protein V4520_20320 [Bacteroidota bacterium]
MNKTILTYLTILFFPFFALAQNEPPVIEDFIKSVKTSNSFAFNDHLNIMQVSTDDENFDLIAINDKMQVVWRTSLAGYGIKTDKLKGKIIALASSDHGDFKGTNNTFIAYAVDPSNGKVLANKTVYKSSDEYIEYPQMYTGEGSFFKLAVRQTAYKRKLHLAGPTMSIFSTGSFYRKELNDTRSLKVIEFDDKLDSVKTFNPVISAGTFLSIAWNKHADMFISWMNGPSIEIYKYDAGKTAPSNQMTVPVNFKTERGAVVSEELFMQPAENPNVLYYSMVYKNLNKDPELGVGKLDFSSGKKAYVVQLLDNKSLKALKKNFVPLNKDLDYVRYGFVNAISVKYMTETSGRVIITVASNYKMSTGNPNAGNYDMYEDALLVNGFDTELQLKYQQFLPVNYFYPSTWLQTGYNINRNKLYIVANMRKGFGTILGVYGVLDINSGKWDKMERLSKKNLDNKAHAMGTSILWFGDNFVVPYYSRKFFSVKSDLSLQLNNN